MVGRNRCWQRPETPPRPDMHLLITRSEPGASRMAQEFAALGHSSVVCSLVRIVATLRSWVAGIRSPADERPEDCFDHVIFVSEHAVQHGVAAVQKLAAGARWYAIGPATEAALTAVIRQYRAGDFAAESIKVRVPQPARSEGLLAEQHLQMLNHQRVLLVAGEDGRELIADTLRNRGALVTNWLTYRREALPATTLAHALSENEDERQMQTVDACVASSGQGLELLTRQWLNAGGGADLPVCVPSPRVATLALELGWQTPVLCDGASAQATIAGLEEAGLLSQHRQP